MKSLQYLSCKVNKHDAKTKKNKQNLNHYHYYPRRLNNRPSLSTS